MKKGKGITIGTIKQNKARGLFVSALLKKSKKEESLSIGMSENSHLSKVYDSCDVLPLKIFLKILETKNYDLLIEEGDPGINLEDLWFDLYEDYLKRRDDSQINEIKFINEQVADLTIKYSGIKSAIRSYLNCSFFPEIQNEILEQFNECFGYEIQSKKEMIQLDKRIDSLLTEIELLKQELPKQDKKQKTPHFYDLIIDLENCFMRTIEEDITVGKWVSLLNAAKRKTKLMNKS